MNNKQHASGPLEDAEDQVSLAIYILYALGALVIGIALYTYWKGKTPYSLMEFDIALGMSYIFFGILAHKQPILYLTISLFLYLAIIGLNYYMDPSTLLSGLSWKAVIIISLIFGLYSAVEGWGIKRKM